MPESRHRSHPLRPRQGTPSPINVTYPDPAYDPAVFSGAPIVINSPSDTKVGTDPPNVGLIVAAAVGALFALTLFGTLGVMLYWTYRERKQQQYNKIIYARQRWEELESQGLMGNDEGHSPMGPPGMEDYYSPSPKSATFDKTRNRLLIPESQLQTPLIPGLDGAALPSPRIPNLDRNGLPVSLTLRSNVPVAGLVPSSALPSMPILRPTHAPNEALVAAMKLAGVPDFERYEDEGMHIYQRLTEPAKHPPQRSPSPPPDDRGRYHYDDELQDDLIGSFHPMAVQTSRGIEMAQIQRGASGMDRPSPHPPEEPVPRQGVRGMDRPSPHPEQAGPHRGVNGSGMDRAHPEQPGPQRPAWGATPSTARPMTFGSQLPWQNPFVDSPPSPVAVAAAAEENGGDAVEEEDVEDGVDGEDDGSRQDDAQSDGQDDAESDNEGSNPYLQSPMSPRSPYVTSPSSPRSPHISSPRSYLVGQGWGAGNAPGPTARSRPVVVDARNRMSAPNNNTGPAIVSGAILVAEPAEIPPDSEVEGDSRTPAPVPRSKPKLPPPPAKPQPVPVPNHLGLDVAGGLAGRLDFGMDDIMAAGTVVQHALEGGEPAVGKASVDNAERSAVTVGNTGDTPNAQLQQISNHGDEGKAVTGRDTEDRQHNPESPLAPSPGSSRQDGPSASPIPPHPLPFLPPFTPFEDGSETPIVRTPPSPNPTPWTKSGEQSVDDETTPTVESPVALSPSESTTSKETLAQPPAPLKSVLRQWDDPVRPVKKKVSFAGTDAVFRPADDFDEDSE
ncbi:hypothetical protein M427DRAFT_138890 [Gonapodya prolifera JEL478]|uniref:Uncharacterized protein n=1 Tax=Gonapodya prolifera (strain JEL478) TaxID=1344416 RepID=A0A139A216_GONPJ|nr:hypothetical protein M427DRAFT_138890 [Gonapodya prolifera JEL478]|eukprot:KXS10812.1 hypothetical protein M427DRAFT_138890 [Gonapodya prolifera JEL478]